MGRNLDRLGRDAVFVSVLVAAVLLVGTGIGTGTAAAQSAPDCSTVMYNGDGTEANPYEVSNVNQLQCINEQGLDDNYVQVSDIDTSETSSWNDGDGFVPIAPDTDSFVGFQGTKFTGTFDGAGYKISNLYIDRESKFIGLFGFVESSSRIKDIGVDNVDISGNRSVGSLAGRNGGTVTDSYATGSVSGNAVGGLVGENFGGTVKKSYSTGSVSGNEEVGGLVGDNGGTITDSYSTGSVSGDVFNVGGLVGRNIDGTVTDSYSTGNVSGSGGAVGGLAGRNFGGTVKKSYSTGSVSGNEEVGGLVGEDFGGTVTNSYWDTQTTGQSTSGGGTGLTTSEMIGSAATGNMTGFDFTDTWKVIERDYPALAWQPDDRGTGGGSNISSNGGSDEGLPGFTVVTALLAILTASVVAAKRRTE